MSSSHKVVLWFVMNFLFSWSAHAQSSIPLDLPALELSMNGSVFAIAGLPDSGYLIGGDFETINGVPRSNLARLNPDGTLDTSWVLNVDGRVNTITVDTTGTPFIGGNFDHVGGWSRTRVAKLAPGGAAAVDAAWGPSIQNGEVNALVVSLTDAYIGGTFTSFAGVARLGLAKVPKSGGGSGAIDLDWNPAATSTGVVVINAMAIDSIGTLIVAGGFNGIGGTTAQNLARLSPFGQGAASSTWLPSVDGLVRTIAFGPEDSFYIGGGFSTVSNVNRRGVAKIALDGIGAVDMAWQGFGSGLARVYTLAVDSAGHVYAGGDIEEYIPSMRNLARFSADGNLDPAWNPGADDTVFVLQIGNDGYIRMGGDFTEVGGEPCVGMTRLSSNGAVLQAAHAGLNRPQWSPFVTAMSRAPDGSLVVIGRFLLANGVPRKNVLRMSPSGQIDPDWNPSLHSSWNWGQTNGLMYGVVVGADGAVYVSGDFTSLGGQPRSGLAKIQAGGVGLADPSWSADIGGNAYALALGEDQQLYVGGEFSEIGGVQQRHLAKVSTTSGEVSSLWSPNPDQPVHVLQFGEDNALFAGGVFHTIGGQARNYLAKIAGDGAGSADPLWNPSPNATVLALAADETGGIYVGGDFDQVGSGSYLGLVKLSASGVGTPSPDWAETFNSNDGFGRVGALAFEPGGTLYVGGSFNQVAGYPLNSLARFSSHTGQPDLAWTPNPNNDVSSMLVGDSGIVYVGGWFDEIGDLPRSGLAAFRSDVIFSDSFD